jgi:lipopolysaccharide transport system ATP-binding protein
MADDVVIRAEGLGKRYVIGHAAERERYLALRDVLVRGAHNFWRKTADIVRGRAIVAGDAVEEFWALKDVSFEVKRGEVLGIIGRNGAGKSTLLKILSRITEPSEGRVTIRGRVASLLEVGTGFHPELTGRENIYLNGAILGMTRAEIRRKFDEIVAFAEIEKFLDTPVKHYSSGMYVRLAFAVAAHLEPEILVVDEVLAVGDGEFQKKCLGKMSDVATGGRTVLFVSHSMPAMASLSSRALLMQAGRVRMVGEVKRVVDHYLSSATVESAMGRREWHDFNAAPGNEHIRVHRIEIISGGNNVCFGIDTGSSFEIRIDYWNLTDKSELVLNLYLFSIDGTPIFESLSGEEPESELHLGRPPGQLVRSICFIPAHLLNTGEYLIRINFLDKRFYKLFDFENCARLSIQDMSRRDISTYGRFAGYVHPKLTWRTEVIGT